MKKITGEHEDLIFDHKQFIQKLKSIQVNEYNKLYKKLKKVGFSKKLEDHLFDYVHNCEDQIEFSEYVDLFYET